MFILILIFTPLLVKRKYDFTKIVQVCIVHTFYSLNTNNHIFQIHEQNITSLMKNQWNKSVCWMTQYKNWLYFCIGFPIISMINLQFQPRIWLHVRKRKKYICATWVQSTRHITQYSRESRINKSMVSSNI